MNPAGRACCALRTPPRSAVRCSLAIRHTHTRTHTHKHTQTHKHTRMLAGDPPPKLRQVAPSAVADAAVRATCAAHAPYWRSIAPETVGAADAVDSKRQSDGSAPGGCVRAALPSLRSQRQPHGTVTTANCAAIFWQRMRSVGIATTSPPRRLGGATTSHCFRSPSSTHTSQRLRFGSK